MAVDGVAGVGGAAVEDCWATCSIGCCWCGNGSGVGGAATSHSVERFEDTKTGIEFHFGQKGIIEMRARTCIKIPSARSGVMKVGPACDGVNWPIHKPDQDQVAVGLGSNKFGGLVEDSRPGLGWTMRQHKDMIMGLGWHA
ncbi:hypothetical protein Tco_0930428 [Tanacetum coccineum]